MSAEASLLKLDNRDGHVLTAYCFEPATTAIAGVVLAPAMAVEQSFYAPFAAYLGRQGFRVWTFDYSGIGESWQGSMRNCKADVSSWINADFEAVIQHARASMAGSSLFVIGHSLGGFITPLLPSAENLTGIINVAVGSGARRHLQPRLQRSTPVLWHVLTPVLCNLFGYFPGAKVGIMGDIPRHALYQWRRWCLNPEYLLESEPGAREAFAAVSCPMLSLFFADDELISESGSRWLHEAFVGTRVDYRVINADEIKSPRIGHFGFFKQQQEEISWPVVSRWLKEKSTG